MLLMAVRIPNDDARRQAIRWAMTSAQLPRLKAMIALAASCEHIETRTSELDRDPLFLNTLNGTLDLRTGLVRPHDRADRITRLVPIEYDIGARAPRWDQFLSEVFAGDDELVKFVRRAVGYSLTGDTREHALFLLWGAGCNGKSIFIEILRALLGEFAQGAPVTTFTGSRDRSTATNDLAMLRGARIVTVQESDEDARFSEALVKSLTGGDAITARFLHKEFFTFYPQFKPWLATNYKPKVRGTDDGFWRRVRLIPFTVSFLGREDRGLLAALRSELPGILTWAMRGCLDWQRNGLGTAAAVSAATNEYREESDLLAAFIDDRLVAGPDAAISSKRLYQLYAEWCEENGERPMKQRSLSQAMLQRDGVASCRDSRERGFSGIAERPPSMTRDAS
jgi:putative DNA primase/helicase